MSDHVTVEDLNRILAQAGISASQRSPMRPRQLRDLRIKPSERDPRPLFIWSAEAPLEPEPWVFHEFPKLLFHRETGDELMVQTADEQQRAGELYAEVPPTIEAKTGREVVHDLLAGLSDDERVMVLEAQRAQRLAAIQAQLAAMPERDLEQALQAARDKAEKGKRKSA